MKPVTTTILQPAFLILASILGYGAENGTSPPTSDPASQARGVGEFSVRAFGAAGDGRTLDTAAVQAAIDACCQNSGGTVRVPPGNYLVGTIRLKSNVTLELAATAVLLGSKDLAQYATNIARCGFVNENAIDKCLLYAEHAERVAVVGRGTVDGQGAAFPVRRPDGKPGERPMLLRFFQCTNVLVEGVTLRNAGAWCSHYRECDGVRVHGVTIHNRANGNGDGIDLMSTRNVRISDCTLLCQDDAICLQNMSDERPTENIVINNCIISTRWAALRTGGAHRGGIRHVAMSNCFIYDTFGCGIKLQVSGNGSLEDMTFTGIVMKNVTSPISLRFGNCHYNNEKRDERFPFGAMRNLLLSNIRATVIDEQSLKERIWEPPVVTEKARHHPGEERQCISICGIPGHPIEGITLSDIHVTFPGGGTKADAAKGEMPELEDQYPEYFMWGVLPAYGLYARHATGLTLNNVRFDLAGKDLRPALVCDDVEDIEIAGLKAAGDATAESLLRLRDTRDAFIHTSRPLGPIATFLQVEGAKSARISLAGNKLDQARKAIVKSNGAGSVDVTMQPDGAQ
jgi:hypothetical protein